MLMLRKEFESLIDKSGKMFRENYLEKFYPEILEGIKNYCKLELPFKQKVYHWFKEIKDYQKCYCGGLLKFKNSTVGYHEYCSKRCMDKDDKIKEKRKNTVMERYGVNVVSKSDDIKNKMIDTNLKIYGYNSPILNEEVKNKSKETLLKNHGVDSPLKSNEILKKVKDTCKLKYGFENVKNVPHINDKI